MLSRENLDPSEYKQIGKLLPQLDALFSTVLALSPEFISMNFPHASKVPIASVCLRDSVNVLSDAKFALREALAHRIWYQNHQEQSKEWVGIYFCRFFIDDTALRLYSASEHLANAIVNMLEIPKAELNKHKKSNRISKQVIVGHYLLEKQPNHKITKAVKKLVNSVEWNKTATYRNEWVHNQPPHVEGLGIVHERRKRWIKGEGYVQLPFGGGDKPKYNVQDLVAFIQPSAILFAEVLADVVSVYIDLLKPAGIQLNSGKLTVTL